MARSKKGLTDPKLKNLKAALEGEHYDVWDRDGFGVRVSDTGRKTFVLMTRYPGSNNATRRAIGRYPAISLAEARETAAQWRKWIERGVDPADEIEARRRQHEHNRQNSFVAVAEDFIAILRLAATAKGASRRRRQVGRANDCANSEHACRVSVFARRAAIARRSNLATL